MTFPLDAGEALSLELALDLIDEDPDQPRQFFDEVSLNELAATIQTRGVKTPISVRPSEIPGRYVVNHGARRVRASKLAGKTMIPAIIDPQYSVEDQMIENIQRESLTAREIAGGIDRMIKSGMKKSDVARAIGKSKAYISQHIKLLSLPEPIAVIFDAGRCEDVTLLNELAKAWHKHPEGVTHWLADETTDITRGSVRDLREFLEAEPSGEDVPKKKRHEDVVPEESSPEEGFGDHPVPGEDSSWASPEGLPREHTEERASRENAEGAEEKGLDDSYFGPDPALESAGDALLGRSEKNWKKPTFKVSYNGDDALVLMKKKACSENRVWIKLDFDGSEAEVDIDALRFLCLQEADA